MKFSVDRGGTFTDIYAEHEGEFYVEKLLSVDPQNYDDAPREGIRRLLEKLTNASIGKEVPLEHIEWIRMGTTVATNALLEKEGEKTALIITKGFKDLLSIGYQNRPELFNLNIKKTLPLYAKVIEIEERVLPDGDTFKVLNAPDMQHVRSELLDLQKEGYDAVAIVLLHAYQFFDHEEKIASLARDLGFKQVSASHEVMPSLKAVIRGDTTVVDAYLTPHIQKYIENFSVGFRHKLAGIPLLFMQSHGGLSPAGMFRGSNAILSGPAGGVVGLASMYDDKAIIGFDMGGTSTDVSRYDGDYHLSFENEIAGTKIRSPQLDILTVASGGGSRLFYKNGMFIVGPQSAGAHPGPLCYRKGGYLSITDANVVLGRLIPEYFPRIFGKSENEALDANASREGFVSLAKEINADLDTPLSIEEIAYGFIKVANDTMSKPIIEVSISRGFDLGTHVLASFGGAGGQHACAIAKGLEIKEIMIHRHAGILSAFGMGQADIIKNENKSINQTLTPSLLQKLDKHFLVLVSKYEGSHFKRSLSLRYEGTEFTLLVDQSQDSSYEESFNEAYKTHFGFNLDLPIVVDELQLQVSQITQKLGRALLNRSQSQKSPLETKKVYFEEGYLACDIYTLDALEYGDTIAGPSIIIDQSATTLIEPNTSAIINQYGDIRITVNAAKNRIIDTKMNAVDLTLFSNLFISIAKQMGRVLESSAISTNIKERLDFSCAIFDAQGDLIANAPHVPVHLGSMSYMVKVMLENFGKEIVKGDVFISNDPREGGSHLPDMTLITPVVKEGEIVYIVANRGHHADIGGIVPGSMPSFSTSLDQEGACFKLQRIIQDSHFQEESIRSTLLAAGARRIDENITDLKAQVAANEKGVHLLEEASSRYGLSAVKAYMGHIQDVSFKAIMHKLKEIKQINGSLLHAEDFLDDGSKISLKISLDSQGAVFDFNGTDKQLKTNQNAPKSVTYSAIVYALRSLINETLPLNGGLLRAVKVLLPKGCFLNPQNNAAVVAGNVTTSQRIVDVIFKAFGNVAASQGCMNNITFGDSTFGYYETIAGGAGAGVDNRGVGFNGADAVHTHMTNTRITDPEVIERRYPVMIKEFSIRENSGGQGMFHGGNGVSRTYKFLKPLKVNLLTERRIYAPWGVNGAKDGAKGLNEHYCNGSWHRLQGKESFDVKEGELLRIKTPGGGGYTI